MIKVLVTGATGFIGSHLVEALLTKGMSVRCLVRSRQHLRWLNGNQVELVEGDCTVPHSLDEAVRGVDLVYHVAGVMWATSDADFYRGNVEGTRNLLQACDRSAPGLQRFVLVSSQAAAGPSNGEVPRTEQDRAEPITPYGVSKLESEKVAISFKDRFSILILRPCSVYGPRDKAFLAYFRLVRRGFLLEFGHGRNREVSLCHVRDVVRGLIDSANSQVASGSVYFLADSKPYLWDEVEGMIQDALGVQARRLVVPAWLLVLLGTAGQVYGRATKKIVVLNKSRAAELMERRWGCDAGKARRELGFAPKTKINDGLLDVIRWYQQEHWL